MEIALDQSAAQLRWYRTWGPDEDDFSAENLVSGEKVGRLYQHLTGLESGKWTWFYTGPMPGSVPGTLNRTGAADTLSQAAEAILELWQHATQGRMWDQKKRQWVRPAG